MKSLTKGYEREKNVLMHWSTCSQLWCIICDPKMVYIHVFPNLLTCTQQLWLHNADRIFEQWLMNSKVCVTNRSSPNLRYSQSPLIDDSIYRHCNNMSKFPGQLTITSARVGNVYKICCACQPRWCCTVVQCHQYPLIFIIFCYFVKIKLVKL
jgi:hypothetical protein